MPYLPYEAVKMHFMARGVTVRKGKGKVVIPADYKNGMALSKLAKPGEKLIHEVLKRQARGLGKKHPEVIFEVKKKTVMEPIMPLSKRRLKGTAAEASERFGRVVTVEEIKTERSLRHTHVPVEWHITMKPRV